MSTLRTVNPNSHEDWPKNENKRENNSGGCELTGKAATSTHKMLDFQKNGYSTVTVTHEGNTALSGVAARIQIPANAQQVHAGIERTKNILGMLVGWPEAANTSGVKKILLPSALGLKETVSHEWHRDYTASSQRGNTMQWQSLVLTSQQMIAKRSNINRNC